MVDLANELKKENAQLLARIQALEAALEKTKFDSKKDLETRLTVLKSTGTDKFLHSGGNAQTGLCPAGTYMVGARMQSDSGGPHGQISNIFPVCRSMP